MQELKSVFPLTVLGKHLFIFIFFPSTLKKNPCRDPLTLQYTEHGLILKQKNLTEDMATTNHGKIGH